MFDIPNDVITSPQLPRIVDHDWLTVDTASYDNFPSDNNPVRVVPKLHDLWDHSPAQQGINLVPNSVVRPLGARSSDEDSRAVVQVAREAKKAAMAGLKGKELSQYLRARFSADHLVKAAEELKKVSEEVGLLGNVYIDASAFNSYKEAESFLGLHRTRLAQDILVQSDVMSPSVVAVLASTFHKNVVDKIEYNENLFRKYKAHLVSNGRIAGDAVIDSKEALRKAFLQDKVVQVEEVKVESSVPMTETAIAEGLEKLSLERSANDAEIMDSLNLSKISPVASFVQENIAKGKTASSVKDMIRSKFVLGDIKIASEAISVILSKDGLTGSNIDKLISDGKITLTLGSELKKIGKKFPIKKATVEKGVESPKQVGASGHLYVPQKKSVDSLYLKASVEALKKGIDVGRVRSKLLQKLSSKEAGEVLAEAMVHFNSAPSGSVANKMVKPKKVALAEPAPRQTLPGEDTIIPQTQEILSFFEGATMDVAINEPFSRDKVEIGALNTNEGMVL